jgi:hypothetical protein
MFLSCWNNLFFGIGVGIGIGIEMIPWILD